MDSAQRQVKRIELQLTKLKRIRHRLARGNRKGLPLWSVKMDGEYIRTDGILGKKRFATTQKTQAEYLYLNWIETTLESKKKLIGSAEM